MNKIKWLSLIRILALIFVLVYHYFKDILPGGFLGVDIFFTLSGYLAAVSVINEFQKSEKFSFFSYIKRRFLRIFPPLFLSILFTLPFAIMLSPDFLVNIGRQIAASLGFVTNYYQIVSGGSYVEQLLPHLYVHTWFLSVEAHLYIMWALVCAFAAFLVNRANKNSSQAGVSALRIILFTISVIGASLSCLRMQISYNSALSDPSAVYFDTFSRAFPFLLGAATGALFAFAPKRREETVPAHAAAKKIIVISAMSLLMAALVYLASVMQFAGEQTYRFGFVLASVSTCIIIVLIRILNYLSISTDEPSFISGIAAMSYNIYLFHWPLYIVFFYSLSDNLVSVLISLAITIALSLVVLRGFEPLFSGHPSVVSAAKSSFRRAINFIFILLFLLPAFFLSTCVILRAPEITSLEEQINTGFVYQDADKIKSAYNLTMAEKESETESEILSGVTIIGDSVTIFAQKKLIETIPNSFVNAEVSREMWQGYDLMMELIEADKLTEYVVISLGTNQDAAAISTIDKIIQDLPQGHRLIFVTPYNGTWTVQWNTYKIMEYERTLPELHHFVTVADWVAVAEANPHILGSDKVHLTSSAESINKFVDCIIEAIEEAGKKPPKP